MSDAPLRVTRQMFLEEYAKCLMERYRIFRKMDMLGKTLARASMVMNSEPDAVADAEYASWLVGSGAAQEACRRLGIDHPTIAKLRALPKE